MIWNGKMASKQMHGFHYNGVVLLNELPVHFCQRLNGIAQYAVMPGVPELV